MNIEEQRNTFETKCKLLKYNGDMTRHHIGNFYIDQTTNWMWQMWLASANREGYKLVPVEPTERMLDSAYSSISDNLHYADLENIYTAMINSHDNN